MPSISRTRLVGWIGFEIARDDQERLSDSYSSRQQRIERTVRLLPSHLRPLCFVIGDAPTLASNVVEGCPTPLGEGSTILGAAA